MYDDQAGLGAGLVTVSPVVGLAPTPLPRSRRVSPLRKQRAIAEELGSIGTALDTMTITGRESAMSDSGHSSSAQPHGQLGSRSESPYKRCYSAADTSPASSRQHSQDSTTSLSEAGKCVQHKFENYEPARNELSFPILENAMSDNTQVIFRKVTIKKKEKTAFEKALEARNSPEPGPVQVVTPTTEPSPVHRAGK